MRIVSSDYWLLDGVEVATPQFFVAKLDGLRATGSLRATGTEVPGRAGLSVRHDLDVMDEADLTFIIVCTDLDANGARPASYNARRQQVENNVRIIMGQLNTAGRKRTVRHCDTESRWWSAPYRVKTAPRVAYGVTGLWTEIEVTLVLTTGYLISETRSSYVINALTEFTVPGSTGPLVDLTFDQSGAAQNSIMSDQIGGNSVMHTGTQAGTWSVDVGAYTSKIGSTSVIATTQTFNVVGNQLFSVLPGLRSDGSTYYKCYANKATTLWARGTRL